MTTKILTGTTTIQNVTYTLIYDFSAICEYEELTGNLPDIKKLTTFKGNMELFFSILKANNDFNYTFKEFLHKIDNKCVIEYNQYLQDFFKSEKPEEKPLNKKKVKNL